MFNFVRIYGVRERNTGRNQNNTGQENKRQASSHLMPCPLGRNIKTNKRQAQATSDKRQASREDNMTENETLKNRLAELSKQNTLLADHLASMCCQADEDTPSEYRTRHFRNTMDGAYEYLEKINYFKRDK